MQIRRFPASNPLPSLRKQPTFCDITTGSPRNDVWETSTEIPSKRLVTIPHAIPFFFLLQTKLGRTLTQKGSLELVVNHVPVLVSEGLTGGLIVRLVGNYAGRLHLFENAVLSSGIDFNQGMESVK